MVGAVGFTAGAATALAPHLATMLPSAPVASAVMPPPSPPAEPATPLPVQWTAAPQRVEQQVNLPRVPGVQPSPPPQAAQPRAEGLVGAAATRGSEAQADPPGAAAPVVFTRLEIADAGTFRAIGRTFRFAGIEALGLDETCRDSQGREWPCGRRAQAAVQQLLRQRSVRCVEVGTEAATALMRCTVGRTDVSAWLVEQGWALPRAGDQRLATLHIEARNARAGRFAPDGGIR
jgi:endonuclease YncB( thermonuclease family)